MRWPPLPGRSATSSSARSRRACRWRRWPSMAKAKTAYVCAECGANALQWFGSCPSCGAAGTLSETITERGFVRQGKAEAQSVALGDVPMRDMERLPSGLDELDRALGGGLVAGQV